MFWKEDGLAISKNTRNMSVPSYSKGRNFWKSAPQTVSQNVKTKFSRSTVMLVKKVSCTVGSVLFRPGNKCVSSWSGKLSSYHRLRNDVFPTLTSPTTLIFKSLIVLAAEASQKTTEGRTSLICHYLYTKQLNLTQSSSTEGCSTNQRRCIAWPFNRRSFNVLTPTIKYI